MRNIRSSIPALVFSVVAVAVFIAAYAAHAQTPAAKTQQQPTTMQPTQMSHAAMDKPAMSEAKEVTLKGEVVDLYDYMMNPKMAQGPDHAKCIRAGFPAGFVSDGQLYLLLGKGQDPGRDVMANMCGVKAELTGKLYETNGVKAIDLENIHKMTG
jgi:hypothetical protein